MFTTEKARSGKLTLYLNGKSIHSRYDPVSEALAFIKQQNFKNKPYLFILIGPALGYLKILINEIYPQAKILSLHMDKNIYDLSIKIGDNWYYGSKTSLSVKLSAFIPDFQLLETAIIKWFPCTQYFPEQTSNIESIIHQFFLERKGSIYTTGNFGRTWLRNINLNILTKRKLLSINIFKSIIIIAASGPTLNDSISLLKKNRKKYILAALSSALSALNNSDIIPDFIFHSDPGFWAKEHLKSVNNNKIPIIMPLTASYYSKIKNPLILINQYSYIENQLLDNNFYNIPAHGTVAGTAYLFFRQLTNNPIIFTGLDLCYMDIKEHVTPHKFDVIYDIKQNRLNGSLNFLYTKLQANENYKAFSTYTGWFNNKSRLSNCYRLNASDVKTNGMKNINSDQFLNMLKNNKNNFISLRNNSNLSISNFINFLKIILFNLQEFESKIGSMNVESILTFFTSKSLLLEIFQYLAYFDIIELSHNYRTDPDKSKIILANIYLKSFTYISSMIERNNYE